MNQWTLLTFAAAMSGSNHWPPKYLYPPSNVPAHREDIDAWIASLLDADVSTANRIVEERLRTQKPELVPLSQRMAEFLPYQVAFASGRGHVRCVRQNRDSETNMIRYDAIYLAQQPDRLVIKNHISFFETSLRPLMESFLERYAGSGEETADAAGWFAYDDWPTAHEFGFAEESSLEDWADSTLLYHSLSGDAVFIKPN